MRLVRRFTPDHGGARDHLSHAAIEAIAHASATVAVRWLSPTPRRRAVAHAASNPLHETWLKKLATGAALGAFALSEPGAGTDAANQQTAAVREGDGYRIKGRKVWVANGDAASAAIVFAATQPGARRDGITAFLVPLDAPGIARTSRDDSLGVRGLGCVDLELDVRVDGNQVLGAVNGGFPLAMWALQGGRVAIAAQALGIGRAALEQAIAHAKTREQFGRPIASFEAIQWMIADTATELDAARMLMVPDDRSATTTGWSSRRWRSSPRQRPRTRRPTRPCRCSHQPGTDAALSPNGCSATLALRRSTKARRKRSG